MAEILYQDCIQVKAPLELHTKYSACESRDIFIDRFTTIADVWNILECTFPNYFLADRDNVLCTSTGTKIAECMETLRCANFLYLINASEFQKLKPGGSKFAFSKYMQIFSGI